MKDDPSSEPNGGVFRSWKEIAAHFSFDERTCHRWEKKYGLPVHRAAGPVPRSPVFAYKDELDRWFEETFGDRDKSIAAGRRPASRTVDQGSGKRHLLFFIPVAMLVVAAIMFIRAVPRPFRTANPVDFDIVGSTLVALGEKGHELWRWDSGVIGLETERFYRDYFQEPDAALVNSAMPLLMIRDLDGDGWNEVLFSIQKKDDAFGEGELDCFDHSGRKLWTFQAGRAMSFGGRSYSADYRIHGINVFDVDGDGKQEVVAVGYQYPQWPCQTVILDCRGRLKGEFWNSGQVKDVAFGDVDGDGRKELVLAAVNNEYGPSLAVFDPSRVSGASPQTGEFKCDGVGPGSEEYYISLPRTDVSLALGDIAEAVEKAAVTKNGHIYTDISYGLICELGQDLGCVRIDWGHGFMRKFHELAAEGKIQGKLDEEYRTRFKKGIRYWNGTGWGDSPVRAGVR